MQPRERLGAFAYSGTGANVPGDDEDAGAGVGWTGGATCGRETYESGGGGGGMTFASVVEL